MKLHTACMPRAMGRAFTLPKCSPLWANRIGSPSAFERRTGTQKRERDVDIEIHTPQIAGTEEISTMSTEPAMPDAGTAPETMSMAAVQAELAATSPPRRLRWSNSRRTGSGARLWARLDGLSGVRRPAHILRTKSSPRCLCKIFLVVAHRAADRHHDGGPPALPRRIAAAMATAAAVDEDAPPF